MEFNYEETDHRPPITFTPPPPNVSYVPHQPLSDNIGWGYNGTNHLEGPNSTMEMSEFIRREMEKVKIKEEIMVETVWTQIQKKLIREEIIADEIVRRRLLEAEVRRELSIEKELAFHRKDGLLIDPREFHAQLSPLEVGKRSIGERFATSLEGRLGEWEGKPLGERFATCLEGRFGEGEGRPVGERFATSLDGRVGMPSMLSCGSGSLGTGRQTSVEPHISEAKLHLGRGKQKEKIIFPAKPVKDVDVCVLPSAGTAKKLFSKEWSCALCQVSASSEQNLNEHLQGKRHKANEEGLTKKANKFKIGWFTEKTPIVSGIAAPLMSTKVSKRSYKKNYFKFWCEMCQIGTDTEKVMKIHQTGKKHLAHKKNLLRFWCDVCQIGTDTEEVMEMHWKGKKHLSGLQQINQKP